MPGRGLVPLESGTPFIAIPFKKAHRKNIRSTVPQKNNQFTILTVFRLESHDGTGRRYGFLFGFLVLFQGQAVKLQVGS